MQKYEKKKYQQAKEEFFYLVCFEQGYKKRTVI